MHHQLIKKYQLFWYHFGTISVKKPHLLPIVAGSGSSLNFLYDKTSKTYFKSHAIPTTNNRYLNIS